MLDPDGLYEYVVDHGAKIPPGVMLHTFDGFIDAGHAARGVSLQLRQNLEYSVVARFDSDQLIDYRERRPTVTFNKGHFSEYEQPYLEVLQFHTPSGQSFLMLDGREPALQWERFAAAVIEIIDYFEVTLTIGLGGAPMAVPHTRPMSLIAHANVDDEIDLPDLIGQEVEFPASASAVLEIRLGEAGCSAIGFVAQVPHYAAGAIYPQSTLALLRRVTDVTGLDLPLTGLSERISEVLASIENQLENNPEGQAIVQQLEQRYDEYAVSDARGALAQAVDLPSGDELGAEFEKFLADADDAASASFFAEEMSLEPGSGGGGSTASGLPPFVLGRPIPTSLGIDDAESAQPPRETREPNEAADSNAEQEFGEWQDPDSNLGSDR